jgi:uncharacterized protein (DUF58 family)
VTPSATPKLKSLVALAGLGLLGGVALGRVELVVVASVFVVALLLGCVATPRPDHEVALELSEERCIEGDEIVATAIVSSPVGWSEAELALAIPEGLEQVAPEQPVAFPLMPGAPSEHSLRLRAMRWGAHPLGLVGLRLHGPGRLLEFERVVDARRLVKVFPRFDRISRGLAPIETQMYSGDYVSKASGDGIEFSRVRPFVRGDSVRRVNWRVTSRQSRLHVNLAQPERDTDVVLFLDTFTDTEIPNGTTLDLTVRGAAAIAQHHLKHNDRVGLVSFGGMLRWLTASMGRTHTYRIADFLLDVYATFSFAWKDIELLPQETLPPSAMIIAFSPLVDDRALKALSDINRRGFSVVVINTLIEDDVAASPGPEGELAYRAWRLQREVKREGFRSSGIPVADWGGREGIEVAMAQLPRRDRRLARRK